MHFITTMKELEGLAAHNPLAKEVLDEGSLLCEQADIEVTDIGTLLTTHKARLPPGRALVLVTAGDAPMALYARSYSEHLSVEASRTPCVVKKPRTFPPPGVDVVADTEEGKLLLLFPEAGFSFYQRGESESEDSTWKD